MSRRNRVGEIFGNVFGFGLAGSALLLGAFWMFHYDPASGLAARSTIPIPETIAVASLTTIGPAPPTLPHVEMLPTPGIAVVDPPSGHTAHAGSRARAKRDAHTVAARNVAAPRSRAKASAPKQLSTAKDRVAAPTAKHDAPALAYCTVAALTRNICLPEAQLTGQ